MDKYGPTFALLNSIQPSDPLLLQTEHESVDHHNTVFLQPAMDHSYMCSKLVRSRGGFNYGVGSLQDTGSGAHNPAAE